MTLTLAGVARLARRQWREERALLVPVTGVFHLLPLLAVGMFVDGPVLPANPTPEQFSQALETFSRANLIPFALMLVVIDFGTFSLLNLLLRGEGRSLGETLAHTARHFLPFVLLRLLTYALLSLGLSFLILPGLFLFARTWLAGAAFAAHPEAGLLPALGEGWRRSGGWVWPALLGLASGVIALWVLATLAGILVLGLLGALLPQPAVLALAFLFSAAIGAAALTGFALLRAAAYRLTAPSKGI
jgi:hypothetical protein